MKRIALAIAFLISGIAAALAQANVQVIGPVTPGDIPQFSSPTVIKDSGGAGGVAPSIPVIHPSSGNLVGAGCNPSQAHSLWWVDQNLCSLADTWNWTSNDPSALFAATVGGTVTVGDRVNLTFTFGSGACASGCTVGYTAVTGDTVTKIAQGLVCAIATNANLFNLNGSTCTNGAVVNTTSGTGGYANGAIVGYLPQPVSGVFNFDFNSTVPLKLVASVTGSATETVTITNTGCGTACSTGWDNNPALLMTRFVSGMAPPAGSQIFAIDANSNDSSSLTAINRTYGTFSHIVLNSTLGSLASRWALVTGDVNGNLNQGTYFQAGISGAGAVGGDKGPNTINEVTYWTNGAYSFGQNASQFQFSTLATTNPFVFSVSGGTVMGINMTPTGLLDVNGIISSLGGGGLPTAGSGVSLVGSTTPSINAQNYGLGTYIGLGLQALSFDFKPSNSATSGWTLSANVLAPDADNVTTLGSAAKSPSTSYAHGFALTASGAADTFINRFAAANVRLGAADAASPVAQTLSVQGVVAGTSNTAGANFTIAGSQGTGTGVGGSILLQTARAGTTGTAQNALVTGFTLDGNTGLIGINTAPGNSSRVLIEDGTGNNQQAWRYTGKIGFVLNQNSAGNVSYNLQDNGILSFTTNNGAGASLQLYGLSGGVAIGATPQNTGANNLYVQGSVSVGTTTVPAAAGSLIVNGVLQVGKSTVASLPTCNAAAEGSHYAVTDATAPTFLGTLTGGGTVHTPVYCNGTAWVAG